MVPGATSKAFATDSTHEATKMAIRSSSVGQYSYLSFGFIMRMFIFGGFATFLAKIMIFLVILQRDKKKAAKCDCSLLFPFS